MGEIHSDGQRHREAVSCFEESLALDPSQAVAHYQAGILYRRIGDERKAATHLDLAVRKGFRNLGSAFNLIGAQLASGQSTEALENARSLVLKQFRTPDVHFRLGRLLFEHLFYREAVKAFRLALDAAPDSYESRFFLGLCHYLLSDYQQAVRTLEPLVHPSGTPEAVNLYAAAQALLGDAEHAAGLLKCAIDKNSASPHAYLNLALLRLEQKKLDEAEELLERLRAFNGLNDVKVFYSVRRYSCPEFAGESWTDAGGRPLAPEKSEFYFQLARSFQERYHHGSAVELLLLARRYEGDSTRVLRGLGVSCLNIDPQSPAAVSLLKTALERERNEHKDWYMLAQAHSRRNETPEALAAFRKTVALHPSAPYYVALGRELIRTGGNEHRREALEAFRRALEIDPAHALANYEMGRLLMQMERLEEALSHVDRALEAEPEFYEAHYLSGRLNARLGRQESARRSFRLFEKQKQTASERTLLRAGFADSGR